MLFPEPAPAKPRPWNWRVASILGQAAAVTAGTLAMLLRVTGGQPAWDSMYWDDYGTFFIPSLEHPWGLLIPLHGYVQVLPHLIGMLATSLPLWWAAKVMAVTGTLVAAACALFVFHSSAGHVKSATLRVLLAVAIVLLPVAPLEIVASTLGAPWYMLFALFWAVLWRPRTRAGMATAGLLAFFTATSTSLAASFAPLLAVRLYVLRRPREHVVTLGWLAGCLVQLPFIITAYHSGTLPVRHPAPAVVSLSFYARDVALPSLGWHLSWWLQSHVGRDQAALYVTAGLAVVFAVILIVFRRSRALVISLLLTSLLFAIFCETIEPYNSGSPVVTESFERGARYSALPIFLIEAALIVAADYALRQRRERDPPSASRVLARCTGAAAIVLIAVLAASWLPDFRYYDANRPTYSTGSWSAVVINWWQLCHVSETGEIWVHNMDGIARKLPVPCGRLSFQRGLHFSLPARPPPGQRAAR